MGYKLWNCIRGLLSRDDNGFDTSTFIEVKQYIEKDQPHVFGLIEKDFHIDRIKLREIMKKFKPSRSHGYDFIDAYSLKVAYPLIEDSILHLVNLSLEHGQFAPEWKFQLVLPLHKKNDPLDVSNYRPVSHIIETSIIIE